jgi:hypothetical protein
MFVNARMFVADDSAALFLWITFFLAIPFLKPLSWTADEECAIIIPSSFESSAVNGCGAMLGSLIQESSFGSGILIVLEQSSVVVIVVVVVVVATAKLVRTVRWILLLIAGS